MKCAFCDIESDWDQAFRPMRRSFSRQQPRPICPGCWKLHEETLAKWVCRIVLVLALLSIVVATTIARPEGRSHLLVLATLVIFLPLAIVVHECAHALAAVALGMRVFRVSYGFSGPLLYRYRFRNCAFEIRRSVPSGFTQAAPRTTNSLRLHWGLFVAAAPASNALVAGVFFAESSLATTLGTLGTAFAWANLIAVISSLFPWKHQTRFGLTSSDGLVLLTLPFEKAEALRLKQASYFALEGTECLCRRDYAQAEDWARRGQQIEPGEIQTRCVLGHALLALKRFAEARDLFIDMAASDEPLAKLPQNKAIFFNYLAWTDLLPDDPSLLQSADHHSSQAMRLTPWVTGIKGTRGAVLVSIGQATTASGSWKRRSTRARTPRTRPSMRVISQLAGGKRGTSRQASDRSTGPAYSIRIASSFHWSPSNCDPCRPSMASPKSRSNRKRSGPSDRPAPAAMRVTPVAPIEP
jgi:Peptidase family M50